MANVFFKDAVDEHRLMDSALAMEYVMEETQIVDELKYLIRFKYRINTIMPADCKLIAKEIRLLTKGNISVTTIKRLLGFARIKYNFSKYTLRLLSDFKAEIHEQLNSDCWQQVMVKSSGVTNQTLLRIKSNSGIPYKHTINRKFAQQHFDAFLNSDCAFTCFISQPGWGKHILLSQLARGFLSNPVHEGGALLFLAIYDFLYEDFEALSISHYIKNKLGIDPALDLVEYIDHNCKNSKFVIFLDGFSRVKVKSNIKIHLFEKVHRFIEEIGNSRVQLVMGIRSADWAIFTKGTSYLTLFKRKWYPGDYFDPENNSNVPPLGQDEIEQILTSINGFDTILQEELKPCLEVPLYLQSYYELRNDLPYSHAGDITSNQIIARFIKFKVADSNYFTEKMYLINKLINYGKTRFGINKQVLAPAILAFGNAYKELLSDGILVERHCMNRKFDKGVNVCFAMSCLYDYFLRLRI